MSSLRQSLQPILERELDVANTSARITEIENQLSDIKAIMSRNITMILDRQEALAALEVKTEELRETAFLFKRKTRALRRWHLMNQVKWGVAVGTMVTVSVAVPVLLLVAV